jgi:hypothetical protein
MAFPCLVALAVTTLSSLAGHLPPFSHTKKLARLLEPQLLPGSLLPVREKTAGGERMRYHGVDLHKRYATVSVRDESESCAGCSVIINC